MRIGIDLGGTKIEGVALAADGREAARVRVPTPQRDYDGTIAAIGSVIADLEQAAGGPASIGIGIPGAISPASGLVKNANSTWLIGRPLDQDLARALGRPVRLANDANCFALSEAVDGAAAGARVVFGVIIGTGVGGGLVVNGTIIEGAQRIAGEWGHNPLPWPREGEWPGRSCYCGRTGCIETYLSGPGAVAEFRRGDPSGSPAHRAALTMEDLVARAGSGEREAVAALDRYADRMARALAAVINVVDPDVIVLGGGLSQIDSLYADVPARWGPFVFSDTVVTRLVRARHGDASGVRGAAWLW
jgi:fructokinase